MSVPRGSLPLLYCTKYGIPHTSHCAPASQWHLNHPILKSAFAFVPTYDYITRHTNLHNPVLVSRCRKNTCSQTLHHYCGLVLDDLELERL